MRCVYGWPEDDGCGELARRLMARQGRRWARRVVRLNADVLHRARQGLRPRLYLHGWGGQGAVADNAKRPEDWQNRYYDEEMLS